MSRKGFLVTVELDVQKVSCPGVCLCSNGKASLQIHMLGSSVQTRNSKPVFPLQFYEKFVFSKTFDQDRRLNELQRRLNQEFIYAELVQWSNCDEGRVLASFRTSLDDLLYPSTFRGTVMGVNVDLLMEPTEIFPGTIAPKLEVSTKTTVEETIFEPYCNNNTITLITPKSLPCKTDPARTVPRKVCHSINYSRAQKNNVKQKPKKPPFKLGKAPEDLILRTNPNVVVKDYITENNYVKTGCYCRPPESEDFCKNGDECDCQSDVYEHRKHCSTCSFYNNYFSSRNTSRHDSMQYYSSGSRNKPQFQSCSYCARHVNKSHHIPSKSGSPCGSDPDYVDSKNRSCFCVPYESTNSLAHQLHQKLVRTLETNNRLLHKCIDFDG